ncbi:unnamed protein product [Meganyctiphanes norvegica]|uniref:Chitin-binding type-2 domain-containing protein n=1 Tax=Meganyctiphanes norvegica TaxID=48144 RepID=A0AAV2PN84_MEGNR
MKVLLLCALVAVAASQFASRPSEVILQRQGNRAILRVPNNFQSSNNFQFGDNAIDLLRGSAGQGSFQQNQQRSQFQQGAVAAARYQQQQQQRQQRQQQQQQQQAAEAAAAQRRQNQFRNQQGQRAPVQPSTILAGAGSGGLVSAVAQVGNSGSIVSQQQQQQQQQAQFQAQQQRQQQQQQQQQYKTNEQFEEVQGVFEPLNLPSGASLLLGSVSTEFSCNSLPYGYYGDEANNCHVFHICYPALFSSGVVETYQYSFMCGEGTQFDQKELACVSYESALPCGETKNYYFINREFGLQHEKTK